MPDSGEYMTVREAYNMFVPKTDLVALVKTLDEHKDDDRQAFRDLNQKIDDLLADRLPKWALPSLVAVFSVVAPVIVILLEKLWFK